MEFKQVGRLYEININGDDSDILVLVCKISFQDYESNLEPCVFFWIDNKGNIMEAAIPITQHNNPMSKRFKEWKFSEKEVKLTDEILTILGGKVKNKTSDQNWLTIYSYL